MSTAWPRTEATADEAGAQSKGSGRFKGEGASGVGTPAPDLEPLGGPGLLLLGQGGPGLRSARLVWDTSSHARG